MNVIFEALHLITQPPGDLVYFLVTLFALQQAWIPLLMSHQAKSLSPTQSRWAWGLGGMLAGRVALILIALLGSVSLISPANLLPPLERWLAVAGILLAMWAALCDQRTARWQTFILMGGLVLSGAFYAYNATIWPAQQILNIAFNHLAIAQIWEAMTIGLVLIALVLALVLRPKAWEWGAGMFLFWLVGHSLQLLWPNVQYHFSEWTRLASLVAYPLLSLLVYRQTYNQPTSTTEPKTALPDSDALMALVQGVESGRELDLALILASSRLARLLNAEMSAIALHNNDEATTMRVVAVHPPNAAQIEVPQLKWGQYSMLYKAYMAQKPIIIQPVKDFPWVPQLYQQLGFEQSGPLVAHPLQYGKQRLGLLLLGSPNSGRAWSENELSAQKLTATLLAAAISRAHTQGKDRSLLERIRGNDDESQRLEYALTQAQQEGATLKQRITELTQQIAARDAHVQKLTQEFGQQQHATAQTELDFWQTEVRELSQDREVLLEDRNRLADQLSQLRAELDTVEDARERLQLKFDKAQQTLDNAQNNLEQGQQGTVVGLVVVNAGGQIVLADALARRMLQLPQGDVIGMPIDGAYPDPNWAKAIDELLSSDPQARRRIHLTLKEYKGILDADLVALIGQDSIPDGLVITLRAPESAAERQEAMVSLANEFRTPMTAITGYTDLLLGEQAGILTGMQQQFLERVKANIEQMGHLLNDMISITSPDSRPIELSPQLINLAEIIEEAIMGLAARFRERKLAVQLDLQPHLTPVRADRDSLYQIMLRLLANAALCSCEGTQVIIRATQHTASGNNGSYIRTSVIDTGGGVAPEDYPRVFRRFYRARQPLVQGLGETGIGMAVAKALVEANGGRIWVESQAGKGSTFTFILPADAAEQGR